MRFESSVNSEGIETIMMKFKIGQVFESSVNSEGIETWYLHNFSGLSLRAV